MKENTRKELLQRKIKTIMQIKDQDTKRLKDFYLKFLNENNRRGAKALGYHNELRQEIRFEVLSQIITKDDVTILDVGCGLGDLYEFLKNQKRTFKYTGIDIVEESIETAKKRFPEADFRVFDFSHELNEEFDFVLASGALTFMVENYKDVYFGMIERMFKMAKIGVAFNMLDQKLVEQDETYATYSPTEIYDYCRTFAEKIILRHDYFPDDFTVYLYK